MSKGVFFGVLVIVVGTLVTYCFWIKVFFIAHPGAPWWTVFFLK